MGATNRHPLVFVFAVAFALRLLTVVVVRIHWHGTLFLDDKGYERMAAAKASGAFESWSSYHHWLYERVGTLLVPITALYEIFGPEPLLGQLYVAVAGSLVAVLVTRLGFEFMPRGWAVIGGMISACLPSQVLWSSLILKDALVWLSLTGLAVMVAVALRTSGRRLGILGAGITALLFVLGFLRLQTLEIATTAVLLTACVGAKHARLPRVAGAALIWLLVPLAFGMGPGGVDYLLHDVGSLQQRRELNAVSAGSAVVDAGNANTSTTTRSATTSAPSSNSESLGSNIKYLPRGLTVILFRPYPWEAPTTSSFGLRLARAEALIWYPLVLLSLVGVWGARRYWRVLLFPVAVALGTLFMYALTEGNLGTAYRHRGEAVWVIALLAGRGLEWITTRLTVRSSSRAPVSE
jgi:hypothetical protein